MRTTILNNTFLEAIKERIPQKSMIASTLAGILFMEKEAVYRRLRGEVSFTFTEVATIAEKLGISLDKVMGAHLEKSKPFSLKLVDYLNPTEEDYMMLDYMPELSDKVKDFTNSEVGMAMNMIPPSVSINYEYIFKFYVFKWVYQYQNIGSSLSFKDVKPDEGVIKRVKHFPTIIARAEKTIHVWDDMIFHNIVKDIHYYYAINLINKEDVQCLKHDLHRLLDDLETLAIKGINELGNKVYFYISSLDFETCYSYVSVENFCLTQITAFTLNTVASVDKETFQRMKQYMQSLKRTSTLISESGEMYRIQFFEKQRDIVNTLL